MNQVLIVGAGFTGAVIARELADAGRPVCLIERRSHVGGNAFDFVNAHGIRVHQYGPHIFHTSNAAVYQWLSRFTRWHPYQHKVKAVLSNGQMVTLPANAQTVEIIGRDNIVDVLFRPYTRKMWGLEVEELDPSIIARLPVRTDLNELYFPDDTYQCMPTDGYTALFERMLDHPLIELQLNQAYTPKMETAFAHCFNGMAIDEFFGFELGVLPYRSIKFHHVNLPMPRVLPVAVVNFTHQLPFTRMTEWQHFPNHGHSDVSTLTYEEPCACEDNGFERYYPVKDLAGRNRETYKRYQARVPANMSFVGRCGQYVYLDMHQAVSAALAAAQRFLKA